MPRQPKDSQQPKRKKSTYGGGSVYYRKGDDRYVASIKDPNSGKRVERYAKTEKEAWKLLEDIKFEIRQNTLATGPRQTVQQFLERWFEDVHKFEIRITTYVSQQRYLKKHIIPAIGHIQLQKLTALHIQNLYSAKIREGLQPKTVHVIHAILHHALKDAKRWKLVSQNVCEDVDPPSFEEKEFPTLTVEQTVYLLKMAEGTFLETMIALALVSLRHGEMIGLRWDDINFDDQSLRVRRTVSRLAGSGYVEGDPKTKKSKREVILPLFVVESLQRQKARQEELRLKAGERWEENNLVFTRELGKYRHPGTDLNNFRKLLEEAGLPRMRIHDLRHTASTILSLEIKQPEKLVQDLLGHETVEMTRERYTHANRDMMRGMMTALDEAIRRQF